MALVGWEWIVIGIVAIVIILWGPSKIPQFARAIGQAKGEFNKASKEFKDAATHAEIDNVSAAKFEQAVATEDQMLLDTAKTLGLSAEGKTREQLSDEISMKVKILATE